MDMTDYSAPATELDMLLAMMSDITAALADAWVRDDMVMVTRLSRVDGTVHARAHELTFGGL